MKKQAISVTLLTSLMPFLLSAQIWQVAKRYDAAIGSTLTNSSVAVSPDGSTYVSGALRGTATFDTLSATTPTGVTQGFLLKMNADYQAVWVQTFDATAYYVTTDAQGNVFLVGAIAQENSDSLTYLAKYAPTGVLLASRVSSGSGRSWPRVVRTDAAGNCFVAGGMTGTVTFGAFHLTSTGGEDGYLAKFSSDLAQVEWAVTSGSTSNRDQVFDLKIDNSGNVYTSGNYGQTYSGIWPWNCFCWSGSFFVEKRSATNGAMFWRKVFSGGSGTSTRQVLALDPSGQSVYAVASFKRTTTFEPGVSLTAETGTDDYHIFAASLSATNGSVQWTNKIALTGDNYPIMATFADGGVYVHGRYRSTTLFGAFLLVSQGANTPFVAKISPDDGAVENAERFAGTSSDMGVSIDANIGRMAVSGNAASPMLTIGDLAITGTSNSIYVAQKLFATPLSVALVGTTPATCSESADGSATVSATGGTPPYSYAWSTGSTGPTADGLLPGAYGVTATDAGGQSLSISVNVAVAVQPAVADFLFVLNGTTIMLVNLSENATSYLWNFGDGNTSMSAGDTVFHTYAQPGAYTVQLTAQNDCGADILEQSIGIVSTVAPPTWAETVRVYPNPSRGAFHLEITGMEGETADLTVFGPDGRMIRRETGAFGTGAATHRFDCADLPPAMYWLRIQIGERVHTTTLVVQR